VIPHVLTSESVAVASPAIVQAQVSIRSTSLQGEKLRRAAEEFEAMLIADFWKSMTEPFSNDDEDALDPGHSTWQDMGVQAMAGALSKEGGFGLGRLILKHLEPLVRGGSPESSAQDHKLSTGFADSVL
jgi:Rod binding domain-containing protein